MVDLTWRSYLLLINVSIWAVSAWMPAPQSFTFNDLSIGHEDLIQRIFTEVFFSVPGTEKKVLLQAAKASEVQPTAAHSTNVSEILSSLPPQKLSEESAQGVVQALPVDHVSTEDLLWNVYNKEIERFVSEMGARSGRSDTGYPKVSQGHLKLMLENVFKLPRSDDRDAELKSAIRMYITRKMYSYNMLSVNHVFQFAPTDLEALAEKLDAKDNLDAALEVQAQGPEEPIGVNVVGVLPGRRWGTPDDKLLIVGAHYDTVPDTPGLDDNGSGVVALLEAARALSEGGCRPEFSVLFVAFDLEEQGGAGSLAFIHHVLYTEVLAPAGWPAVQGAFILDTVMNYNTTPSAQSVPIAWMEQLRGTVDRIDRRGGRGDFLAAIYRRPVEEQLVDAFSAHYSTLRDSYKFSMERFDVDLPAKKPSDEVLFKHMDLMRSDHSRFWYVSRGSQNQTEAPETIPAVLLTDTGPYRGAMAACYHSPCDDLPQLLQAGPENLPFLAHTTQALVNTLVDLSGATCSGRPLTEPPPPLPSVGKKAK
ncbi:uncharacterized protein LOC122365861 [Amphibalanus amphitrite]|uniref:uncharacterized protein LOC122365861 n=1 Tax=Amphibalanus amphitrite TaxID=1232801 RepID=UPI001C923BC3|nr:uncharacterized protein LOC122365861 [Amphibalanus amphitrite]